MKPFDKQKNLELLERNIRSICVSCEDRGVVDIVSYIEAVTYA